MGTLKILMRLGESTGCSEFLLGAHVRRYVFLRNNSCLYSPNMFVASYNYRIRPNYHTYPYKRTVKGFRSLQITASVLFVYFFIKAYVVGTHLNCIDLSMQFKWVLTTYAFIKKNQNKKHKNIAYASFYNSFADLSLSVPLVYVDTYFTTNYPSNFEKPKCMVR